MPSPVSACVLLMTTSLLLLVLPLQAEASSCTTFTSCADCVCAHHDLGRHDECDTEQRCGWCAATSSCHYVALRSNATGAPDTVAAARASCPSMLGAWDNPTNNDDDPGETVKPICDIPTSECCCAMRRPCKHSAHHPLCTVSGTLGCALLMLGIGAVMLAVFLYRRCARQRVLDCKWLENLAESHLPTGEEVLWKGCSQELPPPKSDPTNSPIIIGSMIAATTVPSIIWLIIGLPSAVDSPFGFYFPVFYVGGMALLAWVTIQLAFVSQKQFVYGYAMSSKSMAQASAQLGSRRRQESVRLTSIGDILSVSVGGTSVYFRTTRSAAEVKHQADTAPVFHHLQQRYEEAIAARRAAAAAQAAGAGAGTAAAAVATAGGPDDVPPAAVGIHRGTKVVPVGPQLDEAGNPIKVDLMEPPPSASV